MFLLRILVQFYSLGYKVFVKYCVIYPLDFVIILNSVSSAAALVFDLPLCTQTDTKGKPTEARVRNIF